MTFTGKEGGSGSVSRVLYADQIGMVIICLGSVLPLTSSDLPENLEADHLPKQRIVVAKADASRVMQGFYSLLLTLYSSLFYVLLLGLAPSGVYPINWSSSQRVRSYRTISPLLRKQPYRLVFGAVCFCGTFLRVAPSRISRPLCPVEPGLSSHTLEPANQQQTTTCLQFATVPVHLRKQSPDPLLNFSLPLKLAVN